MMGIMAEWSLSTSSGAGIPYRNLFVSLMSNHVLSLQNNCSEDARARFKKSSIMLNKKCEGTG